MSIIHEALKKVQDKISPPVNHTHQSPVTPKHIMNNPRQLIRTLALITLPIITIVSILFFYRQMQPVIPDVINIKLPLVHQSNKNSNTTAKTALRSSSIKNNNEHQLQGIFIQNDNYIALIDDHMLQVGDTLEDLKVVTIDDTTVNLIKKNNTPLVLRLTR